MAALILPSRRVVQPQGPVEVNSENGLARGLIFSDVRPRLANASSITGTVTEASGAGGSGINVASGSNFFSYGTVAQIGPPLTMVLQYVITATPSGAGRTFGNLSASNYGYGFGPNTTNNRVIFSRSGVNTILTGASIVVGRLRTAVAVADATNCWLYEDGVLLAGPTAHGGITAASGALRVGSDNAGTSNTAPQQMFMGAVFNRALQDAEARELSKNPWQLFRPIQRRIWVPVAGGGGISQTVAFTLEDVSASVSQNLSHAQSLTGTLDDVTASVSQTLSHSQSLDATLDGVTVAASQTLSHSQAFAATLDGITVDINQSAAPSSKDQSLAVTLDSIAVSIAQEGPASLIDTHDGFWAKEWKRIRAREKRKYQDEVQERVEEIQDEIAEVEQQIVEVKQAPKPKKATPARDFYAEQARIVEHLIARRNQLIDEEDEELLLLL